MSNIVASLMAKLGFDTSEFDRKKGAVKGDLKDIKGELLAVGAAATAATVAIGAMAKKFADSASHFKETTNVIDTMFDDSAGSIENWAKTVGESMGRSRQQMREFVGTSMAMLEPMLGNKEAAEQMSQGISQLAVDLGSFWDKADSRAMEALHAALIGNVRPMRAFGVNVEENTIRLYAQSLGIKQNIDDMSDQMKVILRYNYILEKTRAAQGDARKTITTYANQVKALTAAKEDLYVEMGNRLLPTFEKFLNVGTKTLRLIADMSPKMKDLVLTAAALAASLSTIVAASAGFKLLAISAGKLGVAFGAIAVLSGKLILVSAAFIAMGLAIGVAADNANKLYREIDGLLSKLGRMDPRVVSRWIGKKLGIGGTDPETQRDKDIDDLIKLREMGFGSMSEGEMISMLSGRVSVMAPMSIEASEEDARNQAKAMLQKYKELEEKLFYPPEEELGLIQTTIKSAADGWIKILEGVFPKLSDSGKKTVEELKKIFQGLDPFLGGKKGEGSGLWGVPIDVLIRDNEKLKRGFVELASTSFLLNRVFDDSVEEMKEWERQQRKLAQATKLAATTIDDVFVGAAQFFSGKVFGGPSGDEFGKILAGQMSNLISGGGVSAGTIAGGALGAVFGVPQVGAAVGHATEIGLGKIFDAIAREISDADPRIGQAISASVDAAKMSALFVSPVLAPLAAVGGAFWELSKNTKSYARAQELVMQATDQLVSVLEPFWRAMLPGISAMVTLTHLIVRQLAPAIAVMSTTLGVILFDSVKVFAIGIGIAAMGLINLNASIDAFIVGVMFATHTILKLGEWVAGNLADFAAMVGHEASAEYWNSIAGRMAEAAGDAFSTMADARGRQEGAQQNLDAWAEWMERAWGSDYASAYADQMGYLDDNTEALNENTKALNNYTLNLPAGYRVQGAVFGSTAGGAPADWPSGMDPITDKATVWNIRIENMNVNSNDPESFYDSLEEATRARAQVYSGGSGLFNNRFSSR